MLHFDPTTLSNESDVEQKFVMPFLKEVLGYNDEEIKTKEYLVPTEIDKGAGKKIGYYPDYLIYIGGIPCIVLEAKDPNDNTDKGYREARLYASEINKRFQKDINPVKYIISTNGYTLAYSPWDSEIELKNVKIDDLIESTVVFEELKLTLSRGSLLVHANKIRATIHPTKRYKPLLLIGGPSRQNATLSPNTFASDLVPLLRKYFDPDETKWSREVLERGYCSSDEITQYNSTLEALLKDRILTKKGFIPIETSKKAAPAFNDVIQKVVSSKKDIPDPFILIVGGVGSGKSMFIERYHEFLADSQIKCNSHWANIDFNNASENLDKLEEWICQEFMRDFAMRNGGEDFLSPENINRYFAPDLAQRNKIYKLLKDDDPQEYARRITDDLTKWFDDPVKLSSGIIRYYSKDKDTPVIVVFDNVDRRDRDQQLTIFQTVQWFRSQNKCFTILSLRDETYDAYKDSPPLDAFLKPFAFRIVPPRFINVVKRRLELAIEYLSSNSDKVLHYTLPNGFQVTYPSTKLGRYLLSIYISVFNPTRKIRLILESLSGRNIRRALEMFMDILISGYFSESRVLSITEGRSREIPEWLIIRVLMRTNYEFFSDTHGYIQNLLAIPPESKTANNFLLLEVLEYLASRRKSTTSYNIEGYLFVNEILSHTSKLGFTKEDTMWALEVCLNRGLIMADHQRSKGINEDDYVKISASGFYHVRFLNTRSEYLGNIAIDTFISDEDIAKRIAAIPYDFKKQRTERLKLLAKYLTDEYTIYGKLIPEFIASQEAANNQIESINTAIEFESKVDDGEQ